MMHASGILKELESAKIKSPTGKDKWNREAIYKLLSNEKCKVLPTFFLITIANYLILWYNIKIKKVL